MKLSSTFAGKLPSARSSTLRFLVLTSVLFLFATLQAFAQEATVVGSVTDASGAALPNVTVTLTNSDTGQSTTATTSADGQYVASNLKIGHFTVKVASTGFKSAEKTGLVLNVGDRTRVDFQLQVGTASESVTVEAIAPVAVQTDSNEISDVLTGKQITQIAQNGRSLYNMATITPGASSGLGDSAVPLPVGGDTTVSFNGQRPGHNVYTLDGGEAYDRGGSGNLSVMPSVDSIAEFRMLTSNYTAEYGLASSATMTAVIKSGTRQLHASAWEFLRNDALDARNFFNRKPQPVAELRYNTYGFNVGGPISLHPSKSDPKTFFFYNMEWRTRISGQTLNQAVPVASLYPNQTAAACFNDGVAGCSISPVAINVPTAAQVDPSILFAGCGGAAPAGVVQGSAFPNSGGNYEIPSCMINPNVSALLFGGGKYGGIFPQANGTVNSNPSSAQFIGGNNVPTHFREEIVRVDHRFTDRFQVFGHFIAEQINQGFGTSMWSGDNVPTAGNSFNNPSYSAVVHATYTISPTLLNETVFNYNGNRIAIIPNGLIDGSTVSGFTAPSRIFTAATNNLNRIPQMQLGGSTGTQYTAASWPWLNHFNDYEFKDDISWVKGAHQFKFGGGWATYRKVQDLFGTTQGAYNFNGQYTGLDSADMLLGLAGSYNELALQDKGFWNADSTNFYVQDNWRANNRLTLNLGLRWDGIPHTTEANNRMGNFYPSLYDPSLAATFDNAGHICTGAGNGCTGASPGLGASPNSKLAGIQFYLNGIGIPGKNGIPRGLVDNHWNTFGPRVGFAYDLTGKGQTVIRAGFGTMYERIQGNDMYNAGPNIPFSSSANFSGVAFDVPGTSLATAATLPLPVTPASIQGLDRNDYKPSVSYQYSAGVQQQLGAKSVLSIAYVGNQNRHLNDYEETNLPSQTLLPCLGDPTLCPGGVRPSSNTIVPYAGFGQIFLARNEANSHYNSVQIDFHTQASKDLFLQAAYTLSRAIDPSTGGSGFDLNMVSNSYAGWQYDVGPSLLDRTHIAFVNFVYDLPIMRNSDNTFAKRVIGGWQVSGIINMQSGAPLNINENGNVAGNACSQSVVHCTNRPNYSGSKKYPKTLNAWFDPSGFTAAPAGTFGTLGHNAFRGPGRDNWNLAMFKSFAFNERGSRLELRGEFFNAFNHTQYGGGGTNAGISTGFGSGNFGAVTGVYDPREIQLAVKLYF